MTLAPEGNPGLGWVSIEEAILDGDTFSFPEHCCSQHQQQEPRQPARLVFWNENTPLLLLLSGLHAQAWPASAVRLAPAGLVWAPQGVSSLSEGRDTAGKMQLMSFLGTPRSFWLGRSLLHKEAL